MQDEIKKTEQSAELQQKRRFFELHNKYKKKVSRVVHNRLFSQGFVDGYQRYVFGDEKDEQRNKGTPKKVKDGPPIDLHIESACNLSWWYFYERYIVGDKEIEINEEGEEDPSGMIIKIALWRYKDQFRSQYRLHYDFNEVHDYLNDLKIHLQTNLSEHQSGAAKLYLYDADLSSVQGEIFKTKIKSAYDAYEISDEDIECIQCTVNDFNVIRFVDNHTEFLDYQINKEKANLNDQDDKVTSRIVEFFNSYVKYLRWRLGKAFKLKNEDKLKDEDVDQIEEQSEKKENKIKLSDDQLLVLIHFFSEYYLKVDNGKMTSLIPLEKLEFNPGDIDVIEIGFDITHLFIRSRFMAFLNTFRMSLHETQAGHEPQSKEDKANEQGYSKEYVPVVGDEDITDPFDIDVLNTALANMQRRQELKPLQLQALKLHLYDMTVDKVNTTPNFEEINRRLGKKGDWAKRNLKIALEALENYLASSNDDVEN